MKDFINTLWRIILLMLVIFLFGWLSHKYDKPIKIDDETATDIIISQQVIDTYYTN